MHHSRSARPHPSRYQPEEWTLLATLVGEADLAVQRDSSASSGLKQLLEEVVADLRDVTGNFTDPAFLRASRAARRRNGALFSGKGWPSARYGRLPG